MQRVHFSSGWEYVTYASISNQRPEQWINDESLEYPKAVTHTRLGMRTKNNQMLSTLGTLWSAVCNGTKLVWILDSIQLQEKESIVFNFWPGTVCNKITSVNLLLDVVKKWGEC